MLKTIIPLILIAFSAFGKPPYYCAAGEASFRAVDFETLLGTIRIALFDKHAPLTTENFAYYVNQGFYDNTLVHDIERRFIIQAGRYDANSQPKTALASPIKNEWENRIKHRAMRVAMWRDNTPDSAQSAFFINLRDNHALNMPHGYTVFGEVIEGRDRLKRMQYQFSCHQIPTDDPDCHPIVIHSAKLVNIPCEKAESTS